MGNLLRLRVKKKKKEFQRGGKIHDWHEQTKSGQKAPKHGPRKGGQRPWSRPGKRRVKQLGRD